MGDRFRPEEFGSAGYIAKLKWLTRELSNVDPGDRDSVSSLRKFTEVLLDQAVAAAGATPQQEASFPECCLVWLQNGPSSFFGGSGVWLGGRVVLTCNHLFDTVDTPEYWRVSVPANTFANREDHKFTVSKLYRRTGDTGGGGANDLAIMILDGDATGFTSVPVMGTPQFNQAIQLQSELLYCGFGESLNGPRGVKLATRPGGWIWSQNEVRQVAQTGSYPSLRNFGSSYEFIALGLQGRSAAYGCEGDSGGPLYVASSYGNRILAGITSRFVNDGGCGASSLGTVFTRVDAHLPWIRGIAAAHGLTIP